MPIVNGGDVIISEIELVLFTGVKSMVSGIRVLFLLWNAVNILHLYGLFLTSVREVNEKQQNLSLLLYKDPRRTF